MTGLKLWCRPMMTLIAAFERNSADGMLKGGLSGAQACSAIQISHNCHLARTKQQAHRDAIDRLYSLRWLSRRNSEYRMPSRSHGVKVDLSTSATAMAVKSPHTVSSRS